MSLFELEKTLSFDEYIASFDAESREGAQFVDWLPVFGESCS